MDVIITRRFLSTVLPPEAAAFIDAHLLHPSSPLQIYKQRAADSLQRGLEALYPLAQPLVDRALAAAADNQGITGTLAVLTLLFAVVVVMNWVRRLLMWWTRLVMRAVFWAAVAALAAWVWNRGILESGRDAVVLAGRVAGYMAVVKDIWLDEYSRYEAQQVAATASAAERARRSAR